MTPTPEEQVRFLRNIQRLLVEGQFTASYKFALLHAIADLCVLKGDDSGGALDLDVRDIAEKFIELYWQQCRPFQLGNQSTGLILQQNTGRQAAVISKIIKAQDDFGGSLARLKLTAPDLWRSLSGTVKRVVNEMPLWKLQTVGSERLDFLYDNLDATTKTITLKPGVAFCFRAFYGLMRDLIQGAWVRFVQKLNANDLGNLTDLGTFLFDQERSSLEAYKNILIDVQERQCFYCHKDLQRSMDVDHVIPWSRYPADLGTTSCWLILAATMRNPTTSPQNNICSRGLIGIELIQRKWQNGFLTLDCHRTHRHRCESPNGPTSKLRSPMVRSG
ncbi:HNH endonuclease [Stieleria sp. JC731]|uniref:HNH endonuclease n=1 Tax=Pirellulaceae TaxID=2691357 RepID=UPI001E481511|nr:HNH endonuclease [Stieleria sp. JC731]MCC9602882.1 HNH endonuclease [Stieleria sp. JC731]